MGCDIHIVIEALPRDSTEWVGVGTTQFPLNFVNTYTPDVKNWPKIASLASRNYKFFAELAGVRGAGPKPLGLPDDASSMTKWLLEASGGDYYHSHSYCSLEEFVAKHSGTSQMSFAVANALQGKNPLEQAGEFFKIDLSEIGVFRYRVCFAFDN